MDSQPFCAIGSKGQFRGARYGYLPPLLPPELCLTPEPDSVVQLELDDIRKQIESLTIKLDALQSKRYDKQGYNVEKTDELGF